MTTPKIDMAVGPLSHEDACRLVNGPLTQEECAMLLHVSREQVKKLEAIAIQKLGRSLFANRQLRESMRECLDQALNRCANESSALRFRGR